MKFINEPTIELEEKDIKTIEEIRELIQNMPCSRLLCVKCPFDKICEYMDVNEPKDSAILNIRKALNEALIK